MIRSFGSKNTERIWDEQYVKRVDRTVQGATLRKLELIHAVQGPGGSSYSTRESLERLVGIRRGHHSIRVNAKWRICFVWREKGADDVQLVDYH